MSVDTRDESPSVPSSFKPKLIDGVEIAFWKNDERGTFYLAKNPRNSRYLKLHESGKTALGFFDGTKTLGEIEKALEARSFQFDLGRFVEILLRNGFLESRETEPAGRDSEPYSLKKVILRRDSKVFMKISYRLKSFYGTKFFLTTLLIGFAGLALYLLKFGELFSSAFDLFSYETPVLPFLLSIALSLIIEAFHELAHLITAYNYTGKLGEVGYVIHFGFPFVYVDIPEVRSLNKEKTMRILLAGPLTTLFSASVSTFMFFIVPFWQYLWAWNAFSLYLTFIIVLSPFIKTDGYYLLQSILGFPNLFSHAMSYVAVNLKRGFKIVSRAEYDDYMSVYSRSERKILRVYPWVLLIGIILLVPVFISLVIQMRFLQIFQVTADLLAGRSGVYSDKMYTLWLTYTISLLILFLGSIAVLVRSLRASLKKRNH